jgi:hypothetical protein
MPYWTALFFLDPVVKRKSKKRPRGNEYPLHEHHTEPVWVYSNEASSKEMFMIKMATYFNNTDTLQYYLYVLVNSSLNIICNDSCNNVQPATLNKQRLKEGHPFRDILIVNMNRGRHQCDRDKLIEALYPQEQQEEMLNRAKEERRKVVEQKYT